METENKDLVCLEYPYSNEKHVCDSVENAVKALDELGICMNWAVVNKVPGRMCILFYEGWVYRSTPERFVKLPFDKDSQDFQNLFADLLKRIFGPFYINGEVKRSIIMVEPKSKEEYFFVNLCLIFNDETGDVYDKIRDTLHNVADDVEVAEGKVFWLD